MQSLSDCYPLKLLDNAPIQNAGGPCDVEAGQLFLSLDGYIEDPFARTDRTELGEAETDVYLGTGETFETAPGAR